MRLPKSRWVRAGALLLTAAIGVALGAIALARPTQHETLFVGDSIDTTLLLRGVSSRSDALFLAAPVINGRGAEPVSVVKTTEGEARALFDPSRTSDWEAPENAPAWVILAYGRFQPHVLDSRYPRTTFRTAWVVVAEGVPPVAAQVAYTTKRYDLSRLGSVVGVSSSAVPLPGTYVANSFNDALRFAAPAITGPGSTLHRAQPESVSYVETTVGQARAMFDPDRPGGWGLPDDATAWVIRAYGQYETFCMGCAQHTFGPYTTARVVIVKGTQHARSGYSNERYDLSQLGTVVEVPESVWRQYCVPGDSVNSNYCSQDP